MTTSRTLTFLTAALVAASAAGQSTAYETTHYGSASGRPADVARNLRIHLYQCPPTTGVRLEGGLPGNLAGVQIGLNKWTLPINGAVSYVQPIAFLWAPFTSEGTAHLHMWPHLDRSWIGLKVFVQGLHIGRRGNDEVFALSEGLEVDVKPLPSRTFSTTTGKLLSHLCEVAYNPTFPAGPLWERPRRDKPGTLRTVFDAYKHLSIPPAHLNWQTVRGIHNRDTNTDLFLAKNSTNDFAVVFRGTKQIRDWLTNVQAGKRNGFHSGFLKAYESIEKELQQQLTLRLAAIRDRSKLRIYFTGHSLGGAVATIAAYRLSSWLCTLGYAPSNVVLYTFGAPRSITPVHYAPLARAVPHHYAVAAKDDLVTHVPGAVMGFTQIPNMRVIYPDCRIRSASGSGYRNDQTGYKANLLNVDPAHTDYRRRVLGNIYRPDISLDVDSNGNVRLNWRWMLFGNTATSSDNIDLRGKKDWVALYRGRPSKPSNYACGGQQVWAWTDSGSRFSTNWGKARDLHIGYISRAANQLSPVDTFVSISKEYDFLNNANVSLSRGNLGALTAHWSNARYRAWDWIAIYNSDPRVGSPIPVWSKLKLSGGSGSQLTTLFDVRTRYIAFWEKDCATSGSRLVKVVKR